MDIPFERYVEVVSYQRILTSLLGTWWRNKSLITVSEVACSCLDEDSSRLWLFVKNHYWAREKHFKAPFCLRHNLLERWHSVKPFLVMLADRGGLYAVLPPLEYRYECTYPLFFPTALPFSYYCGFFFREALDDVRHVITIAISELATPAGIQLLSYASDGVASDYFIGSLSFDHVWGGMFFRCSTLNWTVLSHFGFYKVSVRMRMGPGFASSVFYRVTENDRFYSGG